DVFESLLLAALLLHQLQNPANILFVAQDGRQDYGLLDSAYLTRVWPPRGIVHLDDAAIGQCDFVADAGSSRDQFQVELALQPLLDDLHVQQAQEAAAESEAECSRAFRFEEEAEIIEP